MAHLRGRSVVPEKLRQRVSVGLELIDAGIKAYNFGREIHRRHFAYTVVISEKDPLYSDVHDWLIGALPEEKHRSLAVASSKSPRGDDVAVVGSSDSDSAYTPKPLIIRFNESATRTITLDGHKISLSLQIPEVSEKTYLSREPQWAKIVFSTNTHAGQKAIVKQLQKINSQRSTVRKANLKMMNQWGSWTTRSDLPPRTLESVILPKDQKERVAENLREFLAAEDHYNRLAIPWHRGYMFHGPPGTGKTSLVKALANEFNLDLWYVSLSDLKAESSLLGLLSEVGPRSILLLEDIDTMRITHDRDGADQGTISMSSLLNTLDGVATPHGLITMMTTNRFEVLDPALTRAGRMDMVEMLDYPSANVISDMFEYFYGETPDWIVSGGHPLSYDIPIQGLSTSQIAEIMKRNMRDPKAAAEEIVLELGNYQLKESVSDYVARSS